VVVVVVVVFFDARSRAEHNTAVKDGIRDSDVMREIVAFLCRSAKHCLVAARGGEGAIGKLLGWCSSILW
jgi:hypothetical protein